MPSSLVTPPVDRKSGLPGLIDVLLRWQMEGLDTSPPQALAHVAQHLEGVSAAHDIEWQTLRLLLDEVIGVTLKVPVNTGEPASSRYRMLSRAFAAGLLVSDSVAGDFREIARDACVLLQQGNYTPAARALTALVGIRWCTEEQPLQRFLEQSRDHLEALAIAYSSPGLTWELRLLRRVHDVVRRKMRVASP